MKPAILMSVLAILLLFLAGCSFESTHLDRIKRDNKLTVIIRNSNTTYYEGAFGPTGLEYELAKRFADYLGVRLEIIIEDEPQKVLQLLQDGKADIAATGRIMARAQRQFLRFGPGYLEVRPQLVYRRNANNRRPRRIKHIIGKDIEVVANTAHVDLLNDLKKKYPQLSWHENAEESSDELMDLVWSQFVDYTIADSTEIKLKRKFYPDLAVAFNLGKAEQIAWAMNQGEDDSLFIEVRIFFAIIEDDGTMEKLRHEHIGKSRLLSFVGRRAFLRDVDSKLPTFLDRFRESASKYRLDWRLLAAMGYQESLWNPQAVSPTGVRGIMMLTLDTAKFVGIEDRIDPEQSIYGGAKYLRHVINRMPKEIVEPDRTWMALASYNVGYGHLLDAREITKQRGGDPNKWVDVKESLPLLRKKKWYSETKHGFARGDEPVVYVSNIRNYYDLLIWQDESVADPTREIPAIPFNLESLAL